MKSALSLAKDVFRNLKPCVHGADTFEAADKTGFRREDILDFSSSVNPLGASEKALEAIKNSLDLIPSYPDSIFNQFAQRHCKPLQGNYQRIML